MKLIPGINHKSKTDLAVLKPIRVESHHFDPGSTSFTRWLSEVPLIKSLMFMMLLIMLSSVAVAQSNYSTAKAFDALIRWMPFLLKSGFFFNILISLLVMLVGTITGVALGLGQISTNNWIRRICILITQFFRNSPWLVLLFVVMLAFPFEIKLFGFSIPVPDWLKAVIGLSLPIMANISEIVRGAVISVPSGQWEAAESLAYSRHQTLWQIILPQCFKRMIPPWMNWYAILTMATPLVSILGVEDVLKLSRDAMEAEGNHPELLMPFYTFILVLFFIYCYPIAKWTQKLERKFSVRS